MPHDNRTRLEPGTRVRHLDQQSDRAYRDGTAVIAQVLKQHAVDGAWEYRVLTDNNEYREWSMVDTIEPV